MAVYRYFFADLISNEIVSEFSLTNVTYSQELNNPGSFSGHLLITDVRESAAAVLDATQPGRTAVYVDRDGVIVWGGILWTRDYTGSSQTLSFGAREFESYYEHRIVQKENSPTYATGYVYSTDIFTAVQDMLTTASNYNPGTGSSAQSDIGIIIPSNTLGETFGLVTDDNYHIGDWEFRTLYDVISQLSKQGSPKGFDFNIDVDYDINYNIVKTLELTSRRGSLYYADDPNAPVLEFPGNIVDYDYPEDGTNLSTVVYGVGNGSVGGQRWWNNYQLNDPIGFPTTYTPQLRSVAADQLANNVPVLESVTSSVNETAPQVVGDIAAATLLARQQPVVVMKVIWDGNIYNYASGVPIEQDPKLGSFKTGDEFRVRINDVRFPDQYDEIVRLARYDVAVGETGPERITGYFVNPNAF